ncbi:MAG: hypothetical protein LBQ19_05650, partial [Synergistaceae bacterium]|nr:hypothetical protein [Synergistaceae bacterium]
MSRNIKISLVAFVLASLALVFIFREETPRVEIASAADAPQSESTTGADDADNDLVVLESRNKSVSADDATPPAGGNGDIVWGEDPLANLSVQLPPRNVRTDENG